MGASRNTAKRGFRSRAKNCSGGIAIPPRGIRAFTYIEVLLAVMIVTYVSLAFIQTLMNNIKAEKLAKFKTMAYSEAVNWIENNRPDFDADALSTTTLTVVHTGELAEGVPYTLEKEITLSSLGDNGKYKTIRVRVSWTERGEDKELIYATIKAKYD